MKLIGSAPKRWFDGLPHEERDWIAESLHSKKLSPYDTVGWGEFFWKNLMNALVVAIISLTVWGIISLFTFITMSETERAERHQNWVNKVCQGEADWRAIQEVHWFENNCNVTITPKE